MAPRGTSPWMYVGCGCVGAIALATLTCVGLGYWGVKTAEQYEQTLRDPAARDAKAKVLLGADTLPVGYQARLFFHLPMVLKIVILSDGPASSAQPSTEPSDPSSPDKFELDLADLGRNTLFFFESQDFDQERDKLRSYLRGEAKEADLDIKLDVDFKPEAVLLRGELEHPPMQVTYTTFSGELDSREGDLPGLYTMALLDCPQSRRLRLLVWFQRSSDELTPPLPNGAPAVPIPPAEAQATTAPEAPIVEATADPAPGLAFAQAIGQGLNQLLGNFNLCRD